MTVQAHSDLEELLESANERIAREPHQGEPYLNRAEVYRIHREWKKALRDYSKAETLDPALDQVWYCRGRMHYEAGRPMAGVEELTRFLNKHPHDGQARLVRGRCWALLKNHRQAVLDYEVSFEHLTSPGPEVFLECAAVFSASGNLEKARVTLEKGRARIGSVITLELRLLEIYRRLGKIEAAMGLLDEMLKKSPEDAELLELKKSVALGEGFSANPQNPHAERGEQRKRK